MIKQRIIYIAAMIIAAIVFIITNTAPPLIALIVMGVYVVISYIYMRLFIHSFKIECSINSYTETNKKIYATISFSSSVFFAAVSLILSTQKNNIMFGNLEKSNYELNTFKNKATFRIPFISDSCGIINFVINDLECFDTLRLFHAKSSFIFQKEITVYPSEISMNTLHKTSSLLERDGYIYDPFKKGNDSSETLEIRNYVYGDSIKSVHWKLSSKLNETVVREFSRPNNFNTLICCDMSLEYNSHQISSSDVTNNIALTSALSHSLAEHGIEHNVCLSGNHLSKMFGIESIHDNARLINEILALKLEKGSFDASATFLDMGITHNYSKLIYIVSEYDPVAIKLLSNDIDITIIQINNEGRNTYEQDGAIEIVSLNAEKLYETSHNIQV